MTPETMEKEEVEAEVFNVEQKQHLDGITMLIERDYELKKSAKTELLREPKHMKKKLAKQAFEKYMELYFEEKNKVKVNNLKIFIQYYK